jgi:hypothetical protein
MDNHYVYGHYDLDGKLKYIGKGLKGRAWSRSSRNAPWNEFFTDYFPRVEMFEMNLSENQAYNLERKLVAKYRKKASLLNLTGGGGGVLSGENHPLYGTQRSQDTIDKMLATKTKNNSFAKYWLGKKRDPELIKKMTVASHTPEAIEKRRQKMLGRTLSDDHKAKIKAGSTTMRRVRCITTGKKYESLSEASKDTGTSTGKICEVCSGKRKSANKQRWEYL